MASLADLTVFLSPDSELPPDVCFLVQGEGEESGGQSKAVRAHRFVLGVVSPVFRGMFFGPMSETAKEIEVKETTPEAFDVMIKYIYNPPGGDRFNLDQIGCPQKLFELLALANRYQISTLATLSSDALGSLAITRDNMIFAATVAKMYKVAFEDASTKLSVKCLKFLFATTSGAGDILGLIQETVEHFPGASLDILRELMDVGNTTLQLPGIRDLVFSNFCLFNGNCFQVGETWSSLTLKSTRYQQIGGLTCWPKFQSLEPSGRSSTSSSQQSTSNMESLYGVLVLL